MADGTKIEWTDATWNPITGCSVASAGCRFCYAMKLAGTRMQHHPSRAGLTIPSKNGPIWTGEVRFNDQWLTQPLAWARPREIFVNAHGDTFHENVPDAWIDQIVAVMALSPRHRFQVLTKRADRMRAYITAFPDRGDAFGAALAKVVRAAGMDPDTGLRLIDSMRWPLPNVWLGVSVEDQENADIRVPELLATPAAVRWLSCEPLLGPLDLTLIRLRRDGQRPTELSNRLGDYVRPLAGNFTDSPRIDQVVVGGESDKGPRARPMLVDWARSLRDQCAAAGTAFLFKQWGDWSPERPAGGLIAAPATYYANGWSFGAVGHPGDAYRVGKVAAGRLLDGRTHDARPEIAA